MKRAKVSAEGWWMVQTTVRPASTSAFTEVITSRAMAESRPDVGSSRKMMSGFVMVSVAMESRFSCPPEMPRIKESPTGESAT